MKEAFRRAVTNPRSVLSALELLAKVNREIGRGTAAVEVEPGEGQIIRVTWPDDAR